MLQPVAGHLAGERGLAERRDLDARAGRQNRRSGHGGRSLRGCDLGGQRPRSDGTFRRAKSLAGAQSQDKAEQPGEIEVGGPVLARSLGELGLIDAYRIYLHPVVLGHGDPYFVGPRPRLRLVAHERIGPDAIRLTYEPAEG